MVSNDEIKKRLEEKRKGINSFKVNKGTKRVNASSSWRGVSSWWKGRSPGEKAILSIGGFICLFILSIMGLFAIMSFTSSISSAPADLSHINIMKSSGGTDHNIYGDNLGYEITGLISNSNSYNVEDIQIEVTFYDKSGKVIKVCNSSLVNPDDSFEYDDYDEVNFWIYASKNSNGSYSLWNFNDSYIPSGATIPFRVYLDFDPENSNLNIAKYSIKITSAIQADYNQTINGTYTPESISKSASSSSSDDGPVIQQMTQYDMGYEHGYVDGYNGNGYNDFSGEFGTGYGLGYSSGQNDAGYDLEPEWEAQNTEYSTWSPSDKVYFDVRTGQRVNK